MGRVEMGLVGPQCIAMKSRMDTGAETSSISAHDIQLFKKEDQTWVRFILDPEHAVGTHHIETPLVRMVDIRKRASESTSPEDFEERPVVSLLLTLGNQTHPVEMSLANRSHFNYGLLIGRNAMHQFDIMIDPQLSFTHKPICPSEPTLVH